MIELSSLVTDKSAAQGCVAVCGLNKSTLAEWFALQPLRVQRCLQSQSFTAEPGQVCLILAETGELDQVVFGYNDNELAPEAAKLAKSLPPGTYRYMTDNPKDRETFFTTWGLEHYQFSRYKKVPEPLQKLFEPEVNDSNTVVEKIKATYYIRDLINTPCEDLGPKELAEEAKKLADMFSATYRDVMGEDLLHENYPAIYHVGKAGRQAPRFIELFFQQDPKSKDFVAIVGKGVCFDTGGLDLKSSRFMRHMKKDMGGAAHALGLAYLLAVCKVKLNFRVLIPAVENAIAANAYRPGDVISTRKGLSIEVGNTDAEGRLILADALTKAGECGPSLIIDFATLTGAARVALGTEVPVYFCNDSELKHKLDYASTEKTDETIWQLPLYKGYQRYLKSNVADLSNDPDSPYGGAISAALFLQYFIPEDCPWIHFDIMAWNATSQPGKPEGGEAMGLLSTFELLRTIYSD